MIKLIYSLTVFLFIHCTFNIDNCSAQWVQTGSNGVSVNCLTVSGINIFAGIYGGGIVLSTNNGNNWASVNNGLTNLTAYALASSGANIFAGTWGNGVFLSTNSGNNWNAVNNGLTNQYVFSFAFSGTNLFAGQCNGGVFFTTNNGNNWTAVGLTTQSVYALAVSGTNLFAGTNNGIFYTTNNGNNWTAVGLSTQSVYALAVSGTNLFAGTNNGVFFTTNNGYNWTGVGLTTQSVYALAVSGTNLFAGTGSGGVYSSNNNGQNWINRNQGFNIIPPIVSLLIANNYIFAGTIGQSVCRRSMQDFIGIQNISSIVPKEFKIEQNFPNPFNPSTNIKFDISKLSLVKLTVYDQLGREIETLVNEKLKVGSYQVDWNASQYPSGIYYYRMQTEDFSDTRKMVLVK